MQKIAALVISLLSTTSVFAGVADQISVVEPYVRLAPPNAPATGAFMVIRNAADKDVRLVKAENAASKVTELHTHLNEGGVMKMRPVPSIEIKAKGEAVLKPGGLHIMLIDLKAAMKEGDVVPMALTFDDGSVKKLDVRVVRPGTAPISEHSHGHHKH